MKLTAVLVGILYISLVGGSLESEYEQKLRILEKEMNKVFGFKMDKLIPINQLKLLSEEANLREILASRSIKDNALCYVCQALIFKLQNNLLPLKSFINTVCNLYITIKSVTLSDFCAKMVAVHVPIVRYIKENSKILDSELACSILLQNPQCNYEKPSLTWTMRVPKSTNSLPPNLDSQYNDRPLKILHLTDFHISMDYQERTVANCGYPVCCKKGIGNTIFGEDAGKWGDYRDCDTPPYMFEDAMNFINYTFPDIDLIYFTGDIVDHTVWDTSVETNSEVISFAFEVLKKSFPGKIVLPVLGNHESTPVNAFAPPGIQYKDFSQKWLYNLVGSLWTDWLPEDAIESVNTNGYYTYLYNNKLRIIGLHNNVCYNFNWWLLYDTSFLRIQLKWLSDLLEESERNGEFVHIIAHVPPGNRECIEPWETHYQKLVTRFKNIIKAQFFGHTHTDELKVFYDRKTLKPINVGFNGASLTPYSKFNPNFKIMTVNSSNYEVIEIDTYIFNITEANLTPPGSPRWYKLYSMKQDYGLPDLSPDSIHTLANKLFTNNNIFNQYFRYYVRDGDASLKDGCDASCRQEITCKVITTESMRPINSDCYEL